MQIENAPLTDDMLRGFEEGQLVGQELLQQGAIHVISTLLNIGCTEENAHAILASLRENTDRVRNEIERRGKVSLFKEDQNNVVYQ